MVLSVSSPQDVLKLKKYGDDLGFHSYLNSCTGLPGSFAALVNFVIMSLGEGQTL